MCSCDWNYVCAKCAGTRLDPQYFDESDPLSPEEAREERTQEYAGRVVAPSLDGWGK